MEKLKENKVTLSWNHDGAFSAVIINGQITELNFCQIGKGPDECGSCLTATDYKYLQNIHSSLGELFKELDLINEEAGYKFSNPTVVTTN